MTNTWYASDWDQAYRPSYAKICHTVVRHVQVHLYNNYEREHFENVLSFLNRPLFYLIVPQKAPQSKYFQIFKILGAKSVPAGKCYGQSLDIRDMAQ